MARPDFSGAWTFNAAASSLEIAAPDSTIFMIDHREPVFALSRTHEVRGRRDTFALELTTDGGVVAIDRDGMQLRAQAAWDGDVLVFSADVVRAGETGRNVVRYSLSGDGSRIEAVERFRSPSLNYDNVWVLDRADANRSEQGKRA